MTFKFESVVTKTIQILAPKQQGMTLPLQSTSGHTNNSSLPPQYMPQLSLQAITGHYNSALAFLRIHNNTTVQ